MELPNDVLDERARIRCERARVLGQLDRLFERRRELDDRFMELDTQLHLWLGEVEDMRLAEEKAKVPATTEGGGFTISIHLTGDSAKSAASPPARKDRSR